MKGTWIISQETVPAAADQDDVAAIGQFAHRLFQGLEVTLINAAGPEPLKDAGRLLVDLFQFRLGHTQTNGLLFQQLAVVDVQFQPIGQ